MVVTGSELTSEALGIDVKPAWRVGRCGECRRKAPPYEHRLRRGRHRDLGGIKTLLCYGLRRVKWRHCGK